jgi:DNA replication protein DnaC
MVGSSGFLVALRFCRYLADGFAEESAQADQRKPSERIGPSSQLPVSRWHEQIGDPPVADGILDRLVNSAHRIEMRGDSMRKNRGKPNA